MSMPPYHRDQVQPYGVASPPPQPPKPKRTKQGILLISAAFLGLCIMGGILIGSFANMAGQDPNALAEPLPTVTVTKTVVATPKASQPANTKAKVTGAVKLKDGTWEVPGEALTGTYTTTAGEFDFCYWARLKDFDGELTSIVSNGNLAPGSRGRITVRKSDGGLELSGGCVWTRQ